ncbi:hypothetical protein [Brevundimonas sp.]|uniref:hypothetical protein n=1 Tax=Brevundimonas sp. TaxID=1871086 RepID=UPI003F71CD32
MAVEKFSAWFFEQPGLVQEAVLYGPPLLVSTVITVMLGGRLKTSLIAWLFNPSIAASVDAHRCATDEEADAEWTHAAKDSINEMIARRRRGIH